MQEHGSIHKGVRKFQTLIFDKFVQLYTVGYTERLYAIDSA